MKDFIGGISTLLFGIVLYAGGFAVHVWTCLISLGEYGIVGFAVSMLAPFLSEIFFIFRTAGKYGWLNTYNIAIAIYVIVLLILAGIMAIFIKGEEKIKEVA